MISAVTPRGDMRFKFIDGNMNCEKFIAFLKKLRADADKPIIVVVDNVRYHVSKKTQYILSKRIKIASLWRDYRHILLS